MLVNPTLSELERKILALPEDKRKMYEEIQREIRAGRGTGDPVKDFFYVIGLVIENPMENEVRKLHNYLLKNPNEPVLLIRTKPESAGCAMTRSLGDYVKETMQIGFSAGLQFDYETPKITIAPRHVERREFRDSWTLENSPMELGVLDAGHLGQRVTEGYEGGCFGGGKPSVQGEYGCEVFYGTKCLEAFFSLGTPGSFALWRKSSNPEDFLKENKWQEDLSYVTALKLLDAKAPPTLQQKYDANLKEHAQAGIRDIITKVAFLEHTEEGLKNIYASDEGKRELERAIPLRKRDLENAVKKALKQEWASQDITVSAIGMNINPKEYLAGLAKKYNISQ